MPVSRWRSAIGLLRVDPLNAGVATTLIALMMPILLTSVLQSASSVAKLYWVGRLGRDAVAALAVSETIAFLLFPLLIGLSTGTSAIVSRAVGAGDKDGAAFVAAQSIVLAVVLGVISTVAGRHFSAFLLWLIGADAHVLHGGTAYLDVLLIGVIPLFVMFIAIAVLNATSHTAEAMLASVVVSIATLVSVPCLVFGRLFLPALGLVGAAWAAVVGDAIGALLCVWLISRHPEKLRFHSRQWWPDFREIRRILRIGGAGFGQLFLRLLAGAVMMRIVSSSGTATVAAYGIGARLDAVILTPSFAMGGAAATMVGINLGAHNVDRAYRSAWTATFMNLAIVVPLSIVVIVFAPSVAAMFNDDPLVVGMASSYLRIVWPMHVFTAVCITLGRAMQGAGDTISSMLVTIGGLWLLQMPLAKFLVSVLRVGHTGLWWSIAAASVVQGVLMVKFFSNGRWRSKDV